MRLFLPLCPVSAHWKKDAVEEAMGGPSAGSIGVTRRLMSGQLVAALKAATSAACSSLAPQLPALHRLAHARVVYNCVAAVTAATALLNVEYDPPPPAHWAGPLLCLWLARRRAHDSRR